MKKLQYKEIKQTFIDFLKDHDAYTRFVVYLCHPNNKGWSGKITFSAYVSSLWSGKTTHNIYTMRERRYRMERLIAYAFSWEDTSEGGIYWLYLSDEWKKVLYDKYEVLGIMYTP